MKADLFLDIMFHSSNQTHLWHLQTKSYAVHMALNGYYSAITGEADRFSEAYMGYKGVRLKAVGGLKFTSYRDVGQITTHLEGICKFCNNLYDEVSKEKGGNQLLAIIDDINECIAKTKYLLTLG